MDISTLSAGAPGSIMTGGSNALAKRKRDDERISTVLHSPVTLTQYVEQLSVDQERVSGRDTCIRHALSKAYGLRSVIRTRQLDPGGVVVSMYRHVDYAMTKRKRSVFPSIPGRNIYVHSTLVCSYKSDSEKLIMEQQPTGVRRRYQQPEQHGRTAWIGNAKIGKTFDGYCNDFAYDDLESALPMHSAETRRGG